MSFRKPCRAVPIRREKRYRQRARRERWQYPALVLAGAALVGAIVGVMPSLPLPSLATASTVVASGSMITGCTATDGDTIRCGSERIRLLAIDAPELPGHCRQGRVCARGDAYASTSSLAEAMTGTLRIERTGTDHYGRTLATVSGDKGDLSCWQLRHGQVIYKLDWDDAGRVRRLCPAA